MSKHALVLGASGITGWGVVNALLSDNKDTRQFSQVTAVTNRPLDILSSGWPSSSKLEIVSGIDLLAGEQTDLLNSLRCQISGLPRVTHVYYHSYKWCAESTRESSINERMLKRCVSALDVLCPSLEYIVLPTGTKVVLRECEQD
ncbi:hypothetical protein FOPE_09990 [Fonsecaea pedrosoi]|nr:hypothetical protein FOPE_09990 [Fonsecaea pedrosoi]